MTIAQHLLWLQSALGAPAEQRPVLQLAGETCPHCLEGFAAGDRVSFILGIPEPGYWHLECIIRTVLGSVAHQEKRCSCYGGPEDEGDAPNMTRREAARAAYAYFQEHKPPAT